MANLAERLRQNAAGPFYVDATCTDCDLCRSLAPAFFRRDDEIGYSFVHRQPVTPDEITVAEDAMNSCPTESIGNDGGATTQG
jgi:ferredoxin